MTLPLYAKISIGIISVVLIATIALVVVTIVTNKDKSPAKTPTMQEWMTSADGVKTLTKALSTLDNSTTFGFNTTGNAKTADKATNADTATNADKATTATNWNNSWNSSVQGIKVNNASNADNSITVGGVQINFDKEKRLYYLNVPPGKPPSGDPNGHQTSIAFRKSL